MQSQLMKWFSKHQRELPWRKNYNPYEVWISEIMLQQTQVATMLPYFERWMKVFPTIESVAKASEDGLLKQWEGLGYYSRARNLRKAAIQIMEKHDGKFPDRYEAILKLPGIGRYTAGAIASIAFNQEKPIVDGNVMRVLSRLNNDGRNTRASNVVQVYWKWSESLIPKGNARNFNQAIMEFGALICTPKSPLCGSCPLQQECRSFKTGTVNQRPNRGISRGKEKISVAVAIIENMNKIFVQKRAQKGLMGGLWEFPGGKLERDETAEEGLKREISEELGIEVKSIRPFMTIKHAYTRFLVDLHCFRAEYAGGDITLNAAIDYRWVEVSEMNQLPFPAANKQLIQYLISKGL